ncbi:MAG TPA: ribosome silencing factor [Acidimicrobiaceae bacterium]|nr:ribosome silencing factor [Acidimicrobiaceae bacterium]HCB37768.1 ribosome silencing factor [Acidimicrobiaceae bacterium]
MPSADHPIVVPDLVAAAMEGADDMGGRDIVALDVGDVLAITDWFVITSAPNVRQVRRIAETVEERVKEAGGSGPLRIEGLDLAQWVLLDFGEFVVHVFQEETRARYALERLWSDVPCVEHRPARAGGATA